MKQQTQLKEGAREATDRTEQQWEGTGRTLDLLSESLWGRPLDGQLGSVLDGGGLLGKTKVTDFGNVVFRNQHISSGQVSVDEVVGLQVLHGLTDISGKCSQTGDKQLQTQRPSGGERL